MKKWDYLAHPVCPDEGADDITKQMCEIGQFGFKYLATLPGQNGKGFRLLFGRELDEEAQE